MNRKFIEEEMKDICSHQSGKCQLKSSNTNYPFIELAKVARELQMSTVGKNEGRWKLTIIAVEAEVSVALSRIAWQYRVKVQMCT